MHGTVGRSRKGRIFPATGVALRPNASPATPKEQSLWVYGTPGRAAALPGVLDPPFPASSVVSVHSVVVAVHRKSALGRRKLLGAGLMLAVIHVIHVRALSERS
jgi:hypothetical protein